MLTTPEPATGMYRLTAALTAAGSITSDGNNWTCPAHPDNRASLSVTERDGRALFNCHAGCASSAVLLALGLDAIDLRDHAPRPVPGPPPAMPAHDTMEYAYQDADGRLLFTVHRKVGADGKKTFRQQAADGSWSVKGVDPVLLGLPAVLHTAAAGGTVHVVEGEKDATAVYLMGAVGTCNPGGAKKWRDPLADALEGCGQVVVWRDRDWVKGGGDGDEHTPGDAWARRVVDSLARRGVPYQVVEAAAGKDAWDHIALGYTLDQAVPVTLAGSGGPELEGAEIVPADDMPLPVARHLDPMWAQPSSGLPVRYFWRGSWLVWTGAHWAEEESGMFRHTLYERLEHARYEKRGKDGSTSLVPWNPAPRNLGPLEDASRSVRFLPASVEAGSRRRADGSWAPPGGAAVAFTNGVLDIVTRAFTAASPAYLNTSSVPFAYNPAARSPLEWLKFLDSVWPGDPQSVALVQEWFGYVLSGQTDQQKILFLQGAPRSGKGTVARILRKLVGEANYAGPTLAGLAETFGLQSLIGKSLAVVSDMRMPDRNAQLVLERLLSISGEDALDINRKYKDPWTGKLPVRLMILSNNLPAFKDPSNAFTGRLLLVQMRQSFLDREDLGLERRLTTELDGILLWALEGLVRLTARGYFVPPVSALETMGAMRAASSPITGFLDDHCIIGPEQSVPAAELYAAYVRWGKEENGQSWSTTSAVFGRDLAELVDVRKARLRINKRNTWVYQGIGLAPREPEAYAVHPNMGSTGNGVPGFRYPPVTPP